MTATVTTIEISKQILPTRAIPTITLSIAKSDEAIISFRRLVFEQYGQRNWIDQEKMYDGIETFPFDIFDHNSDYVTICSDGNEIVAGMRIVKASKHGFPHEKALGLSDFNPEKYYENDVLQKLANTSRENIAEVTKVVGKKRQRMLTKDLAKCIYWYALQEDIDMYISMMDMEFFLLCTNLGIPIDPIGVAIYCEGSWTMPTVICIERFKQKISHEHPIFWNYIIDTSNLDANWELTNA